MSPFSLRSCIIFILLIRLLRASPVSSQHESEQLLAAKIRQQKTEEILKYMNTSTDACVNFVEFSCGNYGKYYEQLVADNTNWSPIHNTIQMMRSKVAKDLNATHVTDSDADRKVKIFYKSCLNRSTTPDSYTDKLKKLVQEFGQMPVLKGVNWRESDFDWAHVVADINHKTDIGIILHAKMAPGFTDNSINRATLLQPDFSLPKKIYYLDASFDGIRNSVESLITYNLNAYLGVDPHMAQQTAKEILNFEIELARGMQDLDTTKPNILYNVTTIDELQMKYLPVWDTKKLFATALDLYPSMVTTQHTYLQNVFEVIQKTPKKTVANYIFYTYLYQYIKSISEGVSCADVAREYFNAYFENRIYRSYITEQDKSYISFLWREIKSALEDTLSSHKLNWIHDETRMLARDKLNAMQFKLASYEDNFDQKYAKLVVNDHDIIDNIYAILRQRGHEAIAKITKPPMFRDPPPNSPAYAPEENVIYIPVGILHSNDFWSPSYPNAINFGSVGFLIAHEMVHGFDDFGRHFDEKGNFNNWWDNESAQNFEERTACIANQYRNYTFRGVNLPALELQAENIADNAAVRIAYKAYMMWYNKVSLAKRQHESLQDMEYNHKQLFFISYAQLMGGATSEDFQYDNDIHLPNELRIKGSLSNLAEFAKAFNCPLESVMNPFRKCEIY